MKFEDLDRSDAIRQAVDRSLAANVPLPLCETEAIAMLWPKDRRRLDNRRLVADYVESRYAEASAASHRDEAQKREVAFDLVNPLAIAERRVRLGIQATAAGITWRDEIDAIVTDGTLAAWGLTIADVIDAVAYKTACIPEVVRVGVHGDTRAARKGYRVIAAGYRLGPAGP